VLRLGLHGSPSGGTAVKQSRCSALSHREVDKITGRGARSVLACQISGRVSLGNCCSRRSKSTCSAFKQRRGGRALDMVLTSGAPCRGRQE